MINKAKLTSSKAYLTYFVIAGILLLIVGLRYLNNFTSVSFNYDANIGSISLHSDGQEVAQPENQQKIRLKKGDYLVRASGKNIAEAQQKISVDGSQDRYDIDFSYTPEYLDQLYSDQQLAIYTAILLEHPSIASDYSLSQAQLYGLGDWFGATLVYNDQKADNRDSLRILLKQVDDKWQLVSKPPAPVLSAPDYPDVPYAILKAINRAE